MKPGCAWKVNGSGYIAPPQKPTPPHPLDNPDFEATYFDVV
jgi:hypothetical protein